MGIKQKVEENLTIWLLGILLAGFLAGLATYQGILEIAQLTPVPSNTVTQQKWIRVTGIDTNQAPAITKYRVVMKVDGVPYSYPGHKPWKDVTRDIRAQDFPLIDSEEYGVEFELIYLSTSSKENTARGEQPIRIAAFPFQGSYSVYSGGSTPTATIHFEVFVKD